MLNQLHSTVYSFFYIRKNKNFLILNLAYWDDQKHLSIKLDALKIKEVYVKKNLIAKLFEGIPLRNY